MKTIILVIASVWAMQTVTAQKYFTKNSSVYFKTKGGLETIEATNKAGNIIIDSKTGQVAFSVLIKGFTFKQKLMQEHFNENYMDSEKLPKSEFKGTISNNADVKYTTDGTYKANVSGKLTLHGVTKDVKTTASITVKSGVINVTCSFAIAIDDYKVAIPDKVSKDVTITITTGKLSTLK
jgi:polyisoprenoid-binding protein YceI